MDSLTGRYTWININDIYILCHIKHIFHSLPGLWLGMFISVSFKRIYKEIRDLIYQYGVKIYQPADVVLFCLNQYATKICADDTQCFETSLRGEISVDLSDLDSTRVVGLKCLSLPTLLFDQSQYVIILRASELDTHALTSNRYCFLTSKHHGFGMLQPLARLESKYKVQGDPNDTFRLTGSSQVCYLCYACNGTLFPDRNRNSPELLVGFEPTKLNTICWFWTNAPITVNCKVLDGCISQSTPTYQSFSVCSGCGRRVPCHISRSMFECFWGLQWRRNKSLTPFPFHCKISVNIFSYLTLQEFWRWLLGISHSYTLYQRECLHVMDIVR